MTREQRAKEIVDAHIKWENNDDHSVDGGCSGWAIKMEELISAIAAHLPDEDGEDDICADPNCCHERKIHDVGYHRCQCGDCYGFKEGE